MLKFKPELLVNSHRHIHSSHNFSLELPRFSPHLQPKCYIWQTFTIRMEFDKCLSESGRWLRLLLYTFIIPLGHWGIQYCIVSVSPPKNIGFISFHLLTTWTSITNDNNTALLRNLHLEDKLHQTNITLMSFYFTTEFRSYSRYKQQVWPPANESCRSPFNVVYNLYINWRIFTVWIT